MYSSYFSRMYVKSYALTYLEQVHNPVSCWTCGCINLFKFEASEFKISLSSNKLQKRLLKNLNISRSKVTEKEKWKRKKKNLDDLKSKKCDPNKKEKPNFLPTNMFMKDLRLWDESELRILMMDPSPWDTSHLWFDQVFGFCSHANGGATRKKLIFSFIYNIACYNTKGMCLVSRRGGIVEEKKRQCSNVFTKWRKDSMDPPFLSNSLTASYREKAISIQHERIVYKMFCALLFLQES